ncbi:MAG: SpoIIE family protein phosphatase, partial [Actinomycetota bacterium]|nr:SpoIIE family protein phosphatase [Actinomycetota bacterium]
MSECGWRDGSTGCARRGPRRRWPAPGGEQQLGTDPRLERIVGRRDPPRCRRDSGSRRRARRELHRDPLPGAGPLGRPAPPTRPAALQGAAHRGCERPTRYLPSGADHLVGGDWWDLLDLGQDSFAFAVGDISGHGIDAAALMGQARAAVCTAARA